MRRLAATGLILSVLAAAAAYLLLLTPHDRYALKLRIMNPGAVSRWEASAMTYDVHLRRGQKYVAAVPTGADVLFQPRGHAGARRPS